MKTGTEGAYPNMKREVIPGFGRACFSYRRITLLSIPGKVYARMLA